MPGSTGSGRLEPDLSRRAAEAVERWGLTLDGPRWSGHRSTVLATHRGSEPLALKVCQPARGDDPAGDEHLALRHWAGRSAVRLVAADPRDGLLLLERLDPSRDLTHLGIDDACEEIGRLLARLQVPAPPSIRPARPWLTHQLDRAGAGVPRRFVQRARGLLADVDEPPVPALLHIDLHFANVLASSSGEWTAIDPQPVAGHPGLDLQPMLRNRTEDYLPGSGFRWGVRQRLEIACEAAGLDVDEARPWAYVRAAVDAVWAAEDGDRDALSLHVALLKALDG